MATPFRLQAMQAALCFIAVISACAPAELRAQTAERALANGLRVIVKEDHRAPTVVSMVWYRAGSIDETNGTTGVAHVLEHMMFKGTREVPGGEFSRLVAAAGGLFRLPRKLPRNVAMELALTGRLDFPAERAFHFGWVNRLCAEGAALDTALELAAEICANAPLAVRESRAIMLAATDADDELGWKLSGDGIMKMFGTEDFSEGLTAFAEKRDPVWKGR
jgi:hypothetical protein